MIDIMEKAGYPTYEELEKMYNRIQVRLLDTIKERDWEKRDGEKAERFGALFLALFAASTTLLVLTWGGVIAI